MFVIYTSCLDNEIIVTTKEQEIETLNKYFTGDFGRDRGTYVREEVRQYPAIVFSSKINWEI